jgi:Alpha-L-arabinofuranosidase B, catalytic/Ricin-type beta-trefoil lectin domain-like
MRVLSQRRARLREALWCAGIAAVLVIGALAASSGRAGAARPAPATAGTAHAATAAARAASLVRPCNIYAASGTPCVAAYSTVRALYRGYRGPLYQVTRASDGTSAVIGTHAADGYVDAAAQDSFCAGTVCTITRIFDQSPSRNDLGVEGIGGNGAPDVGAIANALPVTIAGHPAYGVSVQAGVGYRNDVTRGVPAGSQPQGAYMVTSGTHVDGVCCFDFGNAETSNTDTGNGHMDAINFGTECWFAPCSGSGPWVQADLENGLFAGGNGSDTGNTGNSSALVTAMMQNNGTTSYAIKDGNAQSGGLTTEYSGPLPDIGGYTPMHQEGAVLLGTGGDDSNGSDGTFLEGVITAGYPSAAADSAVQANVVAADYKPVTGGFPATGTPYTITNVNSGKLAEPVSCGTANGTGIELWSARGTSCQQWTFSSAGDGHFVITNDGSGTVLDSVDCGFTDGTLVDLWSSLGNQCQEWDVSAVGSHYTISNVANGMVLDAEDCETANGTTVRQWAQLDNLCQQWDVRP